MTPGGTLRGDRLRLLILAAAWTGLFVLVDPRGDFPLNDDFQYAECARTWLAGGGLRLPQWALSSTLTHAVLGAAVTAPWGASNQALRIWMIVVGGIGAGLTYALARRWRASPDAALLAALTLAVSPLYATLSASFHVDVTCAALALAALHAFLIGREKNSAGWLAAASALAAASGLARQTGFLCVAGGAAALALERRLSARAAAALLLPAGLIGAGFWAWWRYVHGPTWAWTSGAYSPHWPLVHWLRWYVWGFLLARKSKAVQLAALCLAPLAVLAWSEPAMRRRPSRAELAGAALLAGAAAIGWAAAGGLPLIQNTITRLGLGVVVLDGADAKPAGWWGSPLVWHAAAGAALISSLILARAGADAARGPAKDEVRAAGLFMGAPYAVLFLAPAMYDRYVLIVMPLLAAAAAAGRAPKLRALAPAFAAAGLLAFVTWSGLSDYFAWNRARWEAGRYAAAHGIPPDEVEDGFDWDGQFSLTRNLADLRARKPDAAIGLWDWQSANRAAAEVTFSKEPPRAGWRLARVFPYRSPLADGAVRLFVSPRAGNGL